MSEIDLNCPHCRESIIKSYGSEVKMRVKLIKWDAKGMFAICKSCNSDVRVDTGLIKSIQSKFVYEVKLKEKTLL